MLVGSIACSCGRHLTWRCECGAVTSRRFTAGHKGSAALVDDLFDPVNAAAAAA
jgi:hypothetical protein